MINRRNFLRFLAGVPLAMSGSLEVLASQRAEEGLSASEFFKKFPEKLNGAREVRKYQTSGARYNLVHINQSHLNIDFIDYQLPKSDYPKVNAVQKDIYNILTDLSSRGLNDSVRVEGVFRDKDEDLTVEQSQEYRRILGLVGEEFPYLPGTGLKLASEGKIKIEQGDDFPAMMICELARQGTLEFFFYNQRNLLPSNQLEIIQKHGFSEDFYRRDNRENALLELMANEGRTNNVLTYGAAHQFGGKQSCGDNYPSKNLNGGSQYNLADWNSENPDKKFSLIEVFPKNLHF